MAVILGCWELLVAGLMFYTLPPPDLVRAAWGNILISGVAYCWQRASLVSWYSGFKYLHVVSSLLTQTELQLQQISVTSERRWIIKRAYSTAACRNGVAYAWNSLILRLISAVPIPLYQLWQMLPISLPGDLPFSLILVLFEKGLALGMCFSFVLHNQSPSALILPALGSPAWWFWVFSLYQK